MTARIIADKIKYPLDKIGYSGAIYDFGTNAVMHFIEQLDNAIDKLMVVGHNPAITDLANYFGGEPISNIPTCGIYCVYLDISSWGKIVENCGKLKFFEFPKNHES